MRKTAIIIGAGPAGLTAAYELLKRTDIQPIVLEKSEFIGGISRTVDYKGNRMDMGPHRFFSKSDRVMEWWLNLMPLEEGAEDSFTISYQNKKREVRIKDQGTNSSNKKMLVIQRLTRIYFLRRLFAYPIQLSIDTLKTLGLIRTLKILFSFLYAKLFPRRPVVTLEDFIINQFGRQLYLLFFKDYTEKVWGVPCRDISAEWGAQRIKGLSLSKAFGQAIKTLRKAKTKDLGQKEMETSLIEQFLYPKYGPGSLWEEVARQVQEMGGKVYLNQDVQKIASGENDITGVHTRNSVTGQPAVWEGDYFFSTMPVQELIADLGAGVPSNVQDIAAGLQYRDFINVGILLKQLSAPGNTGQYEKLELKDNWIYIQERDVKVGRLMIYNNWGGGMVHDPNTTWIGMEYFCNKADDFWVLDDSAIQVHAIMELEKMDLGRAQDVLDSTVCRMEKTYPAYFGTYRDFDKLRAYTDRFSNLFLIGRNGMHKYNNADHSMLTAMVAVDNICANVLTKENIWEINTEQEYHEEKKAEDEKIGKEHLVDVPSHFLSYVWENSWNRAWILLSIGVFILQFILLKITYPHASFIPDSYSYLEAAYTNTDVNVWPVAYSKFLRLISVFSHSDKITIAFQYLVMQISASFFLLTLFYLLRPGKMVRITLYLFLLLNPLSLFVSNCISADALFIGLSLCWVSTLIWIIYSPARWQIPAQAILLLACFVTRYNAIYYPIISMLAFFLSNQSWRPKLIGISLGLILIFASYSYTSGKLKDLTGKRQFSAFGGWQLANNALYMYQNIPASQRGIIPLKYLQLETMVRRHMDTLNKIKFTRLDSVRQYFYLWSGRAPLVQYMEREWKKDNTAPYFKRWASEGPLYFSYAIHLIRSYPVAFVQSFLAPNAIRLLMPPAEFLGVYNMGQDSVERLAKDWFQYKTLKISSHQNTKRPIAWSEWYSVFSLLVNLLLLIHVLGAWAFGSFKGQKDGISRLLILTILFWLLNAGFSVFASPIVLRYQVFPLSFIFCISLLAGEAIYSSESTKIKRI